MRAPSPSALATCAAVAAIALACTWLPAGAEDAGAAPDPFVPDAAVADLGSDAIFEPIDVHVTWAGSPESTLTVQWRTLATTGYAPKLWIAPAGACAIDGAEVTLPLAAERLFDGRGVPFAVGNGTEIEWIATATGLAPGTDYYYRVGTWDSYDVAAGELIGARLGPVRRARTAPPPGAAAPFAFAVAGDTQGATVDLSEHAAQLAAGPAAFWLFSGDMTSSSALPYWHRWFAAAAPILDAAVAMPVPGNHETLYGTFRGQFALPAPAGAPKLQSRAWSFDYGNAHFVGIDSNVVKNMARIAAWLDADLAAAAANPAIDWKIVVFHHPAYSASDHGCTARVLETWVPVLEARGVDLVFSGHDHDYERTVPIAGGEPAAAGEGVTYIVNGGFFASLYSAGSDWWTAYSEKTDSYVLVQIDGASLHLTALDPNDQSVIDELALTK